MKNKNLEKRAEGKYGLNFNSYKSNKQKNNQKIQSIKSPIILFLSVVILLSTIAFAIPNSLTIQGKLTNIAGASQQGTFNFTFKIYDASTNGNELWAVINQSVTTDANGIYDVILTGLNLSFADQYYLGIAVQGENESIPRINLTSAPYSFRANTSESLNPNASYFVRNLSISGNATIGDGTTTLAISTQGFNLTTTGTISLASNITLGDKIVFRLGEIIDNLVDGWLKVTGALNVTSNLFVVGSANITGDLTVNNTFNVTASSGNANVAGILDAGGLRVIGRIVQVEADAFKIVNYSNEYSSTGFKIANATALIDNATIIRTYLLQSALSNNTDANFTNLTVKSLLLGWTNLTNYPSACPSGQFVATIGDTLTCTTPSPSSGGGWTDEDGIIRLTTLTDFVSIGSNATLAKLYVNDSSATGAFLITNASGTTIFFVNGSSGRIGIGTTSPADILTIIGSVSVFGSLNATFIDATQIRIGADLAQAEPPAFKISNYSAEYDRSGYKIANYSAEYGSSGWKRANMTDFLGDNASLLRVGNMSNIRESLYNLVNFTANLNAQNSSLWNRSSTNTILRFISDNVGIGTTSPTKKLSVNGTIDAITLDPSASTPLINTTGNNLTISSATGSVIIRLG